MKLFSIKQNLGFGKGYINEEPDSFNIVLKGTWVVCTISWAPRIIFHGVCCLYLCIVVVAKEKNPIVIDLLPLGGGRRLCCTDGPRFPHPPTGCWALGWLPL